MALIIAQSGQPCNGVMDKGVAVIRTNDYNTAQLLMFSILAVVLNFKFQSAGLCF